jgi:hypothetical protein
MTIFNPEELESQEAAYDSAATHLFEMASERRLDSMVKSSRFLAQAREIYETEKDEKLSILRREALGLERDAVNEKLLFANRSIYDLNKKYIDVFAVHLPPEQAEEFRKWFREYTYRSVYPDPYDLSAFFKKLLGGDALKPEQKVVVGAIQDDYARRRDELSDKMVTEYLRWYAGLEVHNGYQIAVYEEYQNTMEKLQGQRADNADKAIESVMDVLDDEELGQVQAAAADFRKHVKEFEDYRAELAKQGRDWPRQDG